MLLEKPYYLAYDERYQRVYEAGARLWRSEKPTKELLDFLVSPFAPKSGKVIEFGCGEGVDSCYLAQKGYEVLGIDISKAAVEKAKKVAQNQGVSVEFLVGNVTSLSYLQLEFFDFAVDIRCLHMLINEQHRRDYLKEAHRLLKKNAVFFLSEGLNISDLMEYHPEVYEAVTQSAEWKKVEAARERNGLLPRTIKVGEEFKEITLPMLSAKMVTKDEYESELRQAGFQILKSWRNIEKRPNHYDWNCIIYAQKS